MSDFNLDNFKKSWQEQDVQSRYKQSDIEQMLHKKSRNYVKYIFWISLAEFLIFFILNVFYIFKSEDNNSFLNILKKLGVQQTTQLEQNFEHLYFGLKVISLIITAYFVVQFFFNYKKIQVQDNLKLLILQIVKFRKTVNAFIFTNIVILILFFFSLTLFTLEIFSNQNIEMSSSKLTGFIAGIAVTMLFSVGLIWLYYKIVYGIIMRRLGKNLQQLREIETENI